MKQADFAKVHFGSRHLPALVCLQSSNHFRYPSHTTCAYIQSSALPRTDLSMFRALRQWLYSATLICLVALLCRPWALLDTCIPCCRDPACIIHARSQVTSADPKPALRFLQRDIASYLYASQPLLSRLLPETLWYTTGRTVDWSNVATQ